jgi:hypothetical protein
MFAESHRWLSRSPAMPVPYSKYFRQRKNRSGSKARFVALAVNLSQSMVSGEASLGITGFSYVWKNCHSGNWPVRSM